MTVMQLSTIRYAIGRSKLISIDIRFCLDVVD